MIRVATYQKATSLVSFETRVESICQDLLYCEREKVDVVCFPECHLTGYYTERSKIDRHAIRLDSTRFGKMQRELSKFSALIILGLLEATDLGVFNTAIIFRKGLVLGKYRKNKTNEKYLLSGTELPVFENQGFCFGVNICNDANFPNLTKSLSNKGARVIFFPLNNLLEEATAERWRKKSPRNLIERAQDSGCWIVSSDVAGVEKNRKSYGCTQILSPSGRVVSSVAEFIEGVAIYDITFTDESSTVKAEV